MPGGRHGRHSFSSFSDSVPGFGGFGGHGSLISSFFGGRDPFDDPFFTRPFGGLFESMESSFLGGNAFRDMAPSGFIEQHDSVPKRSSGPIIEEINSDEEKEETDEEKKGSPRKHGRSGDGPYVEDPNDDVEEAKSKRLQDRNAYNRLNNARHQPQSHSFTFQSSTVTYGGANGEYYRSSTARRTGSDGLMFEEHKEADSTTRQATHMIHRGLNNKGHSVTRKLNSDGKVDTKQVLHNLHEEELAGFEETWKGNARKWLPGLNENYPTNGPSISSRQNGQARVQALPSSVPRQSSRGVKAGVKDGLGHSRSQNSRKLKADVSGLSSHCKGRHGN